VFGGGAAHLVHPEQSQGADLAKEFDRAGIVALAQPVGRRNEPARRRRLELLAGRMRFGRHFGRVGRRRLANELRDPREDK